MKNKKRKWLVWLILGLAAVAAVVGFLIYRSHHGGTADVYNVSEIADTGYGDSRELSGVVSEGSVENIVLREGLVQSIAVQEGDTVQKGDLLMTYDTASYQLAIDADQARITMLESQIAQTQKELQRLRSLTPSAPATPTPTPAPPQTAATVTPDTAPIAMEEGARVFACTQQTVVTGALLKQLQSAAQDAVFRVYEDGELVGAWTVYGSILATNYGEEWEFADWMLGEGVTLAGDGTAVIDFSVPHYGAFQTILPEEPEIVINYTAQEIQQMIAEKTATLQQQQRELSAARIKLQRDRLTAQTGEVRANAAGTVTFVGDPSAISVGGTIITIRGELNGAITAYVDELSLPTIAPGAVVYVYSYETGSSFTATVQSIGDRPAEDMYGYGENVSYYPVTCIADDPDVELKVGEGCGVTLMDANADSDAFYLPMAFAREDSDGYYVFADKDGRLEKRYIKTGQILWGSEIAVRGGLTMDDAIAFPYGPDAHEGARTQPGDLEKLYSMG